MCVFTITNNAVIDLHISLQTSAFISVLTKGYAAFVGSNNCLLFIGQCAKWNELARLPYESTQGEGPTAGVLCCVQTSP